MITPQMIYNFYYIYFKFQQNPKVSKIILDYIKEIQNIYLTQFKGLIINQIKKYIGRRRIDTDFPVDIKLDNESLEMLDKLMKKSFRSDMQRRNNVWNQLTEFLAKLDKAKDIKDILFFIDRVNNCVHNTKEITLIKFINGYELLDAFDFAHKSTPEQLKDKVEMEIRNQFYEEKSDIRSRLFGAGNYSTPSYESKLAEIREVLYG
jgi:hypothetical protein